MRYQSRVSDERERWKRIRRRQKNGRKKPAAVLLCCAVLCFAGLGWAGRAGLLCSLAGWLLLALLGYYAGLPTEHRRMQCTQVAKSQVGVSGIDWERARGGGGGGRLGSIGPGLSGLFWGAFLGPLALGWHWTGLAAVESSEG